MCRLWNLLFLEGFGATSGNIPYLCQVRSLHAQHLKKYKLCSEGLFSAGATNADGRQPASQAASLRWAPSMLESLPQ